MIILRKKKIIYFYYIILILKDYIDIFMIMLHTRLEKILDGVIALV